jgi:hypothetical protein
VNHQKAHDLAARPVICVRGGHVPRSREDAVIV